MITLQTAAEGLIFMVGVAVILAWTFAYVRQKLHPSNTVPAPAPITAVTLVPSNPLPPDFVTCPCPKKAPLSSPIRTELHGSAAHLCYLCTACKSEVKLPVT